MKKLTLTCIFLYLFMMSAFAAYQIGSTLGTEAGTNVGGISATANYFSGDRLVTYNVSTTTADVTVAAIYGYDIIFLTPSRSSTEPDLSATYNYTLRNVGNSTQNFVLVTQNLVMAGDFTVVAPSQSVSLGKGVSTTFVITINAAHTATPDATVTLDASLQALGQTDKPTFYIGWNGNTYGGYVSHNQQVVTWVEYPIIIVSKNYTLQAPATYSGPLTDPVPGSTVTFSINYRNIGSGTANNVVFTDIVPTLNTDYRIGSTRNICSDGTVTAHFTFNPTNNPADWTYLPSGTRIDARVARIKINLSPIRPDVSGTLNYSVVIK